MKPFQIMRYLKKYQIMIAIMSVIVGALFYVVAQKKMQYYTAATVIEYTNVDAIDGKAPDGTVIDVSEIYSSNVISQVIDNLGLDTQNTNMDAIRGSIYIEPIISDEQKMTQEAKIELGEEYEIYATQYLVTFTAGVDSGKEYPRKMLNEILNVYFTNYGKNHVNSASGTNGINDIVEKGYDYIEMMEVIDDNLEDALDTLSKKIEANDEFRSYETGYGFTDLYREFSLLKNVELPKISADILHNKITKNRDVLLSKYKNRNNDLTIANNAATTEIEKILKVIESYVNMMSRSDNTNITYEYILPDVYEEYDENGYRKSGDNTREYDQLLNGYVDNRTTYEHNLIDAAYNQYVIDVFTEANSQSSKQIQEEITVRIQNLVNKINSLYKILDTTNDEYNEYLGAVNIKVLASVGVSEKIPVKMFTAFVVVIFGVVGCVGAIMLGRVEDIIEYYAFTNKVDGLPNRAKCDNFIASKEKQILFGDYISAVFKITNLKDENARLGRDTGDKMMKLFAETLTSVFIPSSKVFVGYNGSGQYLVFAEGFNGEQARSAINQIKTVVSIKCEDEEYNIEFQSGMACAEEEKCYFIRKLLSIAMKRVGKIPDPAPEKTQDNVLDDVSVKDEQTDFVYTQLKIVNGTSDSSESENYFRQGEDYYAKFRKAQFSKNRKHK